MTLCEADFSFYAQPLLSVSIHRLCVCRLYIYTVAGRGGKGL